MYNINMLINILLIRNLSSNVINDEIPISLNNLPVLHSMYIILIM